MEEEMMKVDEFLMRRIHILEQSMRSAGEALRNAKVIVRKFEEYCNEYDAYEDIKDSETEKKFATSAHPFPIPVDTRSSESLIPREAFHMQDESPDKNLPLLDLNPEHVGKQINAPAPLATLDINDSLPILHAADIVSQLGMQNSPKNSLPAGQGQQSACESAIEIVYEFNIRKKNTATEHQVQAAKPVPELIPLNTRMKTCQELKPSIGNIDLQVEHLSRIVSISQAKPVQQIKTSTGNNIPFGMVWGKPLLNTGKNPRQLVQHVKNGVSQAAKKMRLEPSVANPKRKNNLGLVMKTCSAKPAVVKVNEWLRALDPKFGTMAKWLSWDTDIDDEDAENAQSKRERADRPMENYPNNAMEEKEQKLMMCNFCNNRLSQFRCSRTSYEPGKKVSCHLCARELLQASYHRHMKAVHGNIVKTQCDICKVILPFTIIGRHMNIVHPNLSHDDKSVGTVLQDEEMIQKTD